MKWHSLFWTILWVLASCQTERVLPLSAEKILAFSEPIRDIEMSPSNNSLWVIGGNTYTSGFVLKSDDDESKPIPAAPMETKVINGVKYRAIKESKKPKKHILKENYDRFFGDK